MKLNKLVLANALALATLVLWVVCSTVVAILPGFSLQVASWWMHGMDLPDWNITLSNVALGGVTITASAWGVGWIFGWSWDVASKLQK